MTRIRLLPLIAFVLVAFATTDDASANGRPLGGTGADSHGADFILFPTTLGLLVSSDDGAAFNWICEGNVGYGGTYDPDYAISDAGDVWATTFEGLRVTRDGGCTWTTMGGAILENHFFSDVEVGSDGKVWVASATGGAPNDVFVSTDDGVTFVSAGLLEEKIWWRSLVIAPSDPLTLYVTGFRLAEPDGNGGMIPAEAHVRRTTDGGANWEPLPVTDFAFGSAPNVFIVAVSPLDPTIVFARVLGARDPTGDDIYRSADSGATWAAPLQFQDPISAFKILADGTTVIVGSRGNCIGDPPTAEKGCVQRSTDGGVTWALATEQPKMGCLHQRSNGELIACGANWDPDNFALGRSIDGGQTWDKVVRFSEISGPLSCAAESPQFECAAKDWPALCVQLGICDGGDAGATDPDAGIGGGDEGGGGGGCFGCSSSSGGIALLALLPLGWLSRRRRRRGCA
ncbi:MAG: hypothetical protein V3V08_16525 [Nannocystaceae bacterium]